MTSHCLRALQALTLAAPLCGCSALSNCPSAQDDITIDRPESTDQATLFFESSPGWQSFDAFPAKTQIRFKHDLGVTPHDVRSFLSFTKKASNGAAGGSFTEAAGNEVAWECIDSHWIVIKNDTCEKSFFVKVIAQGAPDDPSDEDFCVPSP
jgi:hypothetical protein